MQMQPLDEIVLPETEPATEWILENPVQKVSPERRHAMLQAALGEILRRWARGRGDVGTEWRFRIRPPGEYARPFVPDVAFLSRERKAGLAGDDLEQPRVPPDISVEILSPDDRASHVEHKRNVYLAAGVRLVVIVDPERRVIDAYEPDGHRTFAGDATFASGQFPDFGFSLAALFEELDEPE